MNTRLYSENIELRIVTLWALTEAALGGLLHAFRIPFTGLIVGGFAVIYIGLLATFCKPKSILRATTIVILIKFSISPYTPLTAYFAVFLQGILGYSLYSISRSRIVASLTLGISALLLSAAQRIIIVTLIFGQAFWQSIDEFANRILNGILGEQITQYDFSLSIYIILIYLLFHLAGGLLFGIFSYKMPLWISEYNPEFDFRSITNSNVADNRKRKKKWYKKRFAKTVLFFVAVAFILTYIFPNSNNNLLIDVLYMILRAVVIVILWTMFIAPVAGKLLTRILGRKKEVYKDTIQEVNTLIPLFKHIAAYSWKETAKFSKIRRIKEFLLRMIAISLTIDLASDD